MEETLNSEFDQFEKKEVNRRALLPAWIKVFCWLFMIGGIVGVLAFFMGVFGYQSNLSFYGFETKEPLSLIGSFIIAIMSFKAFAAFSLWFEKDNAILLGKIDAISGIIICVISMIAIPMFTDSSSISLRLELVLLIPYYYKLDAIKNAW